MIGNLTQLETVSLSGSILKKDSPKIDVLPASIGNWTNLKKFSLKFLPVRDLPEGIGNWERLEECVIDNTLVSSLPLGVKKWRALKLCLLESSQFERLPLGMFGWENLETFRMNLFSEEDRREYLRAKLWDLGNYECVGMEGIAYLRYLMYQRCVSENPSAVEGFHPPSEWAGTTLDDDTLEEHLEDKLTQYSEHGLASIAGGLLALERNDLATRIYLALVQANPKLINYREALEGLKNKGEDLATKEARLTQKVSQVPGILAHGVMHTLANVKSELGKHEEAIKLLSAVVQKIPKSGELKYDLAKAYERAGNVAEAKRWYGEVLRMIKILEAPRISLREIEAKL